MVVPIFRIGKQSAFGVVSTDFNYMPRGNTSINKNGEWEKRVALGGRAQSVSIPTSIVFDGSTEIAIGFNALLYMIGAFCGKDSDVNNVIKPNLSYQPDYYTIDLADNDEQLRFHNCVVDSLSLSTSPDNELTGTIGYISNRSSEVSFVNDEGTLLYDGSDILYYQLTDVNFGGVDLAGIGKSFTFECSNNIDSTVFNVLKGREYPLIRYGDLTGSITMDLLDFESLMRKNLWGNATMTGVSDSLIRPMIVTFTNKLNGRVINITGNAKVTNLTTSTPVNEITTTSVTFGFEYNSTNGSLFQFDYTV